MTLEKPRLILIAGPTTAGKSALATELAAKLSGAIINADAMQVYRDMPILTAQPDAASKKRAPHLLYEIIDPAEAFSAGKWLAEARKAITKCQSDNKIPILVGGTGMYFQSLLKGLADIPPAPPELRQELQSEFERDGETVFRNKLAACDATAAATIQPGDKQRLIRAMEVVRATGKTQSAWQDGMPDGLLKQADLYPMLIMPPRSALYAACEQRFINMLRHGALDEARGILSRQLPATLPAMKVIGLREFAEHLAGHCTLDAATATAQQATRNYAKRQMTWFRNQWAGNKIGFTRPPLIIDTMATAENLPQALSYCM